VFRVSRTGSTASPLTVFYSVTGTARPGTDYTALPGSVTIAAGSSAANILVRPINDTRMEGNETVVVALSSRPAYTIGSPSSATVTIISNE
jgi:Calx-beta domain